MKKNYKKICSLILGLATMVGVGYGQNLLTEDFSTATGTTPPTGWVQNDITVSGELWEFDNPGSRTFNAPITDPAAIFDSDNYGSGGTTSEETALESPTFDASTAPYIFLSFDHYFNDGANGEYHVEVFDGTVWTEVLGGTIETNDPQHENIDITTACGASTVAQVRFRWVGDWSYYWIVDNISVDVISCPAPTALNAFNLTGFTADIAWTEAGSATSWQVEYGTNGFTQGTGTLSVESNDTVNLSTLTPVTAYDFYVRAICGPGDTSLWVGPYNFTTTVSCPAPTALNVFNLTGFTADIAWTEAGSATSWQVEYGTNGFTQGSGTLSVESNDTVNLSTLTPETDYDFYVRAICGPGDTSLWVGPYTFTTTPSCPTPTALNAINLTGFTADITWTEAGAATSWQVEYGTNGFTQGTGALSVESNDTVNLSTLTPETDYDFYVRAICGPGDTSLWVGPTNFTTLCSPVVAPWTEAFENGGTIPTCWNQGASNAEPWKFSNTPGSNHIGNNGTIVGATTSGGYFAWVDDSSPQSMGTTLESPLIDISALTIPQLSFYLISNNEGHTNVDFSVDVFDGSTWHVGFFTHNTNTLAGGWEKIIVNLSSLTFTGPMQLRFVVDETNSTDFYDDVAIDDIDIHEQPSCPDPTVLTLNNAYSDSAEITWTAGGTETAWNIQWGAPGFTPGTGTELGGSSLPTTTYMITGLTPMTNYDVYVQANCGGSTSAWVGPLNILTTQIPVSTFPYSQDWEGAENGNWSLGNGTETNQWVIGSAIANGGTQSLYVSNDGGTTYAYTTNSASVVHAYRDFSFPAVAPQILMSFDWQSVGETVAWDKMRIYIAPTSYVPTSGTEITTSGTAPTGIIQIGQTNYNDNSSFITENITIPAAYAGQDARIIFEWDNDGSGSDGDPAAVDNFNVQVLTCPGITNLVVDSTTVDSISVSWTAGGIETSWNIEWGAPGFTPGTGTEIGGTTSGTTVYHITGLNASSTYDIYVQSNCGAGDVGNWVLVQGATDCAPISTLPWAENFDAMASVGSGLFPLCWIDENGEWYSANNTYVGTDISSPNNISVDYSSDDYIWTPEFNLDSGVIYSFSFKWIGDGDDGWDGSVYVSPSQSSIDAVQIGTNFIVNTEMSPGTIQKETYCFTPDSSGVYSFGIYISSNFSPWTLSFDDFSLRIPSATAGVDGATTVCQTAGNVDLNAIITINDPTGNWTFAPNPTAIVSDTLFNPSSIAVGIQNVYYVVGGCIPDTVTAAINIVSPASAGTDGTQTTCNYGVFNLFDGLTGNVSLGGTWYDPASQPITGSFVNFNGEIPASYNYIYIVDNATCPGDYDTSIVEIVLTQCAGVDEYALNGFNFYPNPTNGVVNIQYAGKGEDVQINVIDTKGAVVWTKQVQFTDGTTQKIDLTQFENGTYFINMRSKNGAKVMKVVKN